MTLVGLSWSLGLEIGWRVYLLWLVWSLFGGGFGVIFGLDLVFSLDYFVGVSVGVDSCWCWLVFLVVLLLLSIFG